MTFFYGDEFATSGPALTLLTGVAILYLLFFWGNSLILSLGRYRLQFFSHCLGLAVAVTFAIMTVPIYEADAMALASLLGLGTIYGIYTFVAIGVMSKAASTDSVVDPKV